MKTEMIPALPFKTLAILKANALSDEIEISAKELSELVGVSRPSIFKAIDFLEKHNIIKRETRSGSKGRGKVGEKGFSNIYYIIK